METLTLIENVAPALVGLGLVVFGLISFAILSWRKWTEWLKALFIAASFSFAIGFAILIGQFELLGPRDTPPHKSLLLIAALLVMLCQLVLLLVILIKRYVNMKRKEQYPGK